MGNQKFLFRQGDIPFFWNRLSIFQSPGDEINKDSFIQFLPLVSAVPAFGQVIALKNLFSPSVVYNKPELPDTFFPAMHYIGIIFSITIGGKRCRDEKIITRWAGWFYFYGKAGLSAASI